MNITRWGANMLESASPVGLILAGAALALAMPPVRRGLRSVAVAATQGALAVVDGVQSGMTNLREEMEDIVAEARMRSDAAAGATEEQEAFLDRMRSHGRRMAVTAATGAMAMRDEMDGIVAEARTRRDTGEPGDGAITTYLELDQPVSDGLEAAEVDLGDDTPRRKRVSRTKM